MLFCSMNMDMKLEVSGNRTKDNMTKNSRCATDEDPKVDNAG